MRSILKSKFEKDSEGRWRRKITPPAPAAPIPGSSTILKESKTSEDYAKKYEDLLKTYQMISGYVTSASSGGTLAPATTSDFDTIRYGSTTTYPTYIMSSPSVSDPLGRVAKFEGKYTVYPANEGIYYCSPRPSVACAAHGKFYRSTGQALEWTDDGIAWTPCPLAAIAKMSIRELIYGTV